MALTMDLTLVVEVSTKRIKVFVNSQLVKTRVKEFEAQENTIAVLCVESYRLEKKI